jgi:hypothetical protein
MQQAAAFLPVPPAIQYLAADAGWPEGANSYYGPAKPNAAAIPYYQRSRHIFGDLKIEVYDAAGKLVDTVASSKRRGVNRAMWSMRLKPPTVPPAATAAFGAATGPRVVPGAYTIKMTKGDQTYTTKLDIVLDPRAKFTVDDRKAQFDLVQRIGGMLNHMSWAVAAIVGVREQAAEASSKLPANDPLRKKLAALAGAEDMIRGKIVATKEGGAITGEERLREFLAGLYGDVNSYEGRPTDSQTARADVLKRELDDVVKEFNDTTNKQLADVNKGLAGKGQKPISILSEPDWQKANSSGGSGGGAMQRRGEQAAFDRD